MKFNQYLLKILCFSFLLGHSDELYQDDKLDKSYEPIKTSEKIVIDGRLEENSWKNAAMITDFTQVFPNLFSNPTEITSVQVLYDIENIYFGVTLNQPKDSIASKIGFYDDFENAFDNNSDYFIIELDTQHKHENSFGFAVNASNVKADYMVYSDDSNSIDDYWNGEWDAKVSINPKKWIIEFKIPFTTLRFTNSEIQNWGINFIRYIKHNNEMILWSIIPELKEKIVSQYGHLINLEIEHKNFLEFKPYYWIGKIDYKDNYYVVEYDSDDNPFIPEIDGERANYTTNDKDKFGFDLKYNFSGTNILDFTYNPDYGQIEQDPSIVNNTAYEVFFDEKRPFFLENSKLYDTPIKVFYSRRIGDDISYRYLNDDYYKKTNFNIAANLLGNSSNWQYGLLYADSEIHTSGSEKVKYYLLRNKYKILEKGSIGIMNTFYEFPNLENFSKIQNSVHSADFSFNFLKNKSIYIDGQFAQSIQDDVVGYGYNVEIGYSFYNNFDRFIESWFKIENYDRSFNINKMGFLLTNDLKDINFGIAYNRYNLDSIYERQLVLEYSLSKNYNNQIIQDNLHLSYKALLNNYNSFKIGISKDFEYYLDRFYDEFFGIETSQYTLGPLYETVYLKYSNDERARNNYLFTVNYFNDNYNENGFKYSIINTYKFNPKMEIEIFYEKFKQFSKYHFLKIKRLGNGCGGACSNHDYENLDYLFINSDNEEKYFTLKLSSHYTQNISFQFYYEFYRYLNDWDENSQLYKITDDVNSNLINVENYNLELIEDPVAINNFISDIDENKIIYMSKYTSMVMNFVMKARTSDNSNLHFVYSVSKGVNGRIFNNAPDLLNFESDDISHQKAEIYYDNSFFIKYDFVIKNN